MEDAALTGYADAIDPRKEYEDLIVDRDSERVDAAAFESFREMEAFRSGWVAVGVVTDESDRLLLVYHADDEQWFLPGGTLQPGEGLREGLVREIREEAGIEVTPRRPHAVAEWVVRHGDDRNGFTVVVFEAHAEQTDPGEDLGQADEEITEAKWFETLPENVFHRELADRVVERVRP